MPEEIIVDNCSPTLAGIKTGNLFSVEIKDIRDVTSEVRELNDLFRKRGLRVIPLKITKARVLIYIYRPDRLKQDLRDPVAASILSKRGYSTENPEGCLVQLIRHLKQDESFPHEIGLFLGYPPSDVKCFMEDSRAGVQCCGCWKAYSDPEKAQDTFRRFRWCTDTYREMHKNGKPLVQLAVATGRPLAG